MAELTDFKGNKKVKPSGKNIRRTYGISDKILKDNPELVELLQILKDQRKKGIFYKDADVAQMVSETDWFMRHTESWMKIQKDRASKDPDLWDALMQEQADNIKDKFLAAGADIDNPTALKYAEDITYGSGWNGDSFELFDEEYIQDAIAGAIDYTKTGMVAGVEMYDFSGEAETMATTLYETARAYGYDTSLDNSTFTTWFQKSIKGLMDGTLAVEDVDDELMSNAVSRFPGLAKQIQNGATLMEAANPYLQTIADTWEQPVASIDLNSDIVQKVLNFSNGDNKFAPMNLYDAKKEARSHANFDFTEKAKTEKMSIAEMMLKDFGF